ncbi:DDE Tnp4 domain-containing protein [Trichonephila clavipes]|nr:DDE Tnp4 domain-containing protein [Trichonephila clavipes]
MSEELVLSGVLVLSKVIKKELIRRQNAKRKKRKVWVKPWVGRRTENGASHTLLKELKNEDHTAYRNMLRNTGFPPTLEFSRCCGAIDGKLVLIKRPPGSGSVYYNYKKTYSIILFAVVDADYCFTYVDVGGNGRANDSAVFRNSSLNIAMENKAIGFPEDHVIIGDDAFPLRPDLMKPFSKHGLSDEEKIFNYRTSRARRVSENAFGILAWRFRVFSKAIELKPDTIDRVILAACSLQN